VTHHHHDR
jgi:hypothetical protein